MIAILDYDAGNIKSVEKALQLLGEETVLTRDRDTILSSEKVILPGVGAFGDAMANLEKFGLVDVIHEVVDRGIPFLGICLGLQLLFESSEESPGVKGLGVLKGRILRIPEAEGLKIPHMGWNSISFTKQSPLFDGIEDNAFVYFVHSYYMCPNDKSIISATCNYSEELPIALSCNNIHAVQFHPEKSGEVGLKMLKNFVEMVK